MLTMFSRYLLSSPSYFVLLLEYNPRGNLFQTKFLVFWYTITKNFVWLLKKMKFMPRLVSLLEDQDIFQFIIVIRNNEKTCT